MLNEPSYTTEQMIAECAKANGVEVSSISLHQADNFAMDNDYYYFPYYELYKKPNDDDILVN